MFLSQKGFSFIQHIFLFRTSVKFWKVNDNSKLPLSKLPKFGLNFQIYQFVKHSSVKKIQNDMVTEVHGFKTAEEGGNVVITGSGMFIRKC